MRARIAEYVVEESALAWLESLGCQLKFGSGIVSGDLQSESGNYHNTVLKQRLFSTLPPKFIAGQICLDEEDR